MATILTIIPYKFFPPKSGGSLRCFYILKEMARSHKVYVLTSQPIDDFCSVGSLMVPENVEIISTYNKRRYKSFVNILPQRIADAINFRFLNRSFKGPTNSYLIDVYPTLNNLLRKISFDIIYYENLEALGLIGPLLKTRSPSSSKVYDAHNVDSELWLRQAIVKNNPDLNKYARKALTLEKQLFKSVDAFFCCSNNDKLKLTILNKNKIEGVVIPNGVDTTTRPFDNNNEKWTYQKLIFCGSLDYFPNKEGLLWFYKEVFPVIKSALPDISLTIIGSINELNGYEQLQNDPKVHFVGGVDNLIPFYQQTSIAIVPLLSGSGTRLKVLEAMSMGNPVVSTTIGAEGINCCNGVHLMITDSPNDFGESVINLLNDKTKFNLLRANALGLVRTTYNWHVVGERINQSLQKLLNQMNVLTCFELLLIGCSIWFKYNL